MSRLKFLISSAVFIIMTAVKLTLPGLADEMCRVLLPRLDMNSDYREAMTSLGEMITGDDGVISALANLYARQQAAWGGTLSSPVINEAGRDSASGAESPGLSRDSFSEAPVTQESGETEEEAASAVSSEPSGQPAPPPAEETAPAAAEETVPAAEESVPEPVPPQETVPGAVSAFLESQSQYEGYEIPSNVSVELHELPFDFAAPVQGYNSSGFGFRRHPLEDEIKFHYGTDMAAYEGTYIYSFADGTVLAAGESDSYGLYVIVGHDGGYKTLYAHCSTLLVNGGDTVEKGQLIAQVGATGQVTGAHLHFELMKDSLYLNPEFYV